MPYMLDTFRKSVNSNGVLNETMDQAGDKCVIKPGRKFSLLGMLYGIVNLLL